MSMELSKIYKIYKECGFRVCTDTRRVVVNSLFFSLSGENFNGNKFASEALNKGCSYAVCDDVHIKGDRIIHVEDVLKTLQNLANYHRSQFDIPILAITGSNGKTTTKELLASVLSKKFNLLYTKGNLNNHIGVPLTLLELRNNHDFALIEMGANKKGDINELCEIADPTHGVITNIGLAHIEGFGSREGVTQTKSELYRYIISREGLLFVNNNESYLLPLTENYPHSVEYGQGTKNNFELLKNDSKLELRIKDKIIQTNLFGKYNANNALTAFVVGENFGVDVDKIVNAIGEYTPTNNRSQIKNSDKGNYLVLDAYNANPSSMNLAIDELLLKKGEKVFILGDMKELGSVSKKEHQKVIEKIKFSDCKAIFVGPEFKKFNHSEFCVFENVELLIQSGELDGITNSNVLIKGSRSVQLEKIEAHL
ncbi:MAG: UDP-N-acetylmuramoyl-tripeptide--D-alanyl-D-alanine ligase [Flavobacteriales bacterium]|nr:UDP-N-acetylmuramoyl-tripeptide--D-alanyl-D-alanine ligase [Flavobacteriales bacterium]